MDKLQTKLEVVVQIPGLTKTAFIKKLRTFYSGGVTNVTAKSGTSWKDSANVRGSFLYCLLRMAFGGTCGSHTFEPNPEFHTALENLANSFSSSSSSSSSKLTDVKRLALHFTSPHEASKNTLKEFLKMMYPNKKPKESYADLKVQVAKLYINEPTELIISRAQQFSVNNPPEIDQFIQEELDDRLKSISIEKRDRRSRTRSEIGHLKTSKDPKIRKFIKKYERDEAGALSKSGLSPETIGALGSVGALSIAAAGYLGYRKYKNKNNPNNYLQNDIIGKKSRENAMTSLEGLGGSENAITPSKGGRERIKSSRTGGREITTQKRLEELTAGVEQEQRQELEVEQEQKQEEAIEQEQVEEEEE